MCQEGHIKLGSAIVGNVLFFSNVFDMYNKLHQRSTINGRSKLTDTLPGPDYPLCRLYHGS